MTISYSNQSSVSINVITASLSDLICLNLPFESASSVSVFGKPLILTVDSSSGSDVYSVSLNDLLNAIASAAFSDNFIVGVATPTTVSVNINANTTNPAYNNALASFSVDYTFTTSANINLSIVKNALIGFDVKLLKNGNNGATIAYVVSFRESSTPKFLLLDINYQIISNKESFADELANQRLYLDNVLLTNLYDDSFSSGHGFHTALPSSLTAWVVSTYSDIKNHGGSLTQGVTEKRQNEIYTDALKYISVNEMNTLDINTKAIILNNFTTNKNSINIIFDDLTTESVNNASWALLKKLVEEKTDPNPYKYANINKVKINILNRVTFDYAPFAPSTGTGATDTTINILYRSNQN
jgi:hypothetical protein